MTQMQADESIYINTLGCARNLVDAEVMAAHIQRAGYAIAAEPDAARVILVHTCGFIESAINESIDTILALAEYKKTGPCMRLIVTGCLPERFGRDIADSLPEVDVFLGTGAQDRVVDAIAGTIPAGACIFPNPESLALATHASGRRTATYPMAYLKIAEGCNRHCTYCIIPKLKGRLRSRAPADILREAEELIAAGYKEIVLIAQDSSAYGTDLTPPTRLAGLLRQLAENAGGAWLRFLYGSPDHTDAELIRTVGAYPQIAPYFDLPVQHVSARVLKRMGRAYSEADLLSLMAAIREAVPDAVLRTTLLTGFPGETEADFEQLMGFLEKVRFDHVGVFSYSDGQDLPAHNLPDHVPESVAGKRRDRLMERQAEISLEKNQQWIGRACRVLVEERIDEAFYMGRTQFQAPEVDGVTYIEGAGLTPGDFIDVRINAAYAYDLKGELAWPA